MHEKDEMFTDSSLSIDNVVARIADEASEELVDSSGDEDGGSTVCGDPHGPARPWNHSIRNSPLCIG